MSTDPETMVASPGRMTRTSAEMPTPRPLDPTTFPDDEGYDEPVLARSLPVPSVCQHHLLPFTGVLHVGYPHGVRAADASTVISALHGHLRNDPRARAEFLALTTR